MAKEDGILNEDNIALDSIEYNNHKNLNDIALLSALITKPNKTISAVETARNILNECKGKLIHVTSLNFNDLTKIKGVTKRNAQTLIAAFELYERIGGSIYRKINKITCSNDSVELLVDLKNAHNEQFWIIYLNNSLTVIECSRMFSGGVDSTTIDVKMILHKAIELLASQIIIAHNHPSGDVTPTDEDIVVTEKIKKCCELIDIKLLDHIIISKEGFYSFGDNAKLFF